MRVAQVVGNIVSTVKDPSHAGQKLMIVDFLDGAGRRTGENAVVVNSRKADVIIGQVGIVIADALFGEITPLMAKAVAQSSGKRILIPVNHCDNIVVGVGDLNLNRLIQDVIRELEKL